MTYTRKCEQEKVVYQIIAHARTVCTYISEEQVAKVSESRQSRSNIGAV